MATRRSLCGQDPEGSQPRRSASGAAHEIRSGDQLEDGKTDRSDDSSKCVGESGQGDSMKVHTAQVTVSTALFALSAMLFVLCLSAEAKQPKKLPRIAFLSTLSAADLSPRMEAFRQGLHEVGYFEDKNL